MNLIQYLLHHPKTFNIVKNIPKNLIKILRITTATADMSVSEKYMLQQLIKS